jgi:hypothetical protein
MRRVKSPSTARAICNVSTSPSSHPAKHHAQIVRRHFGDRADRESNELRYCNGVLEISQTPGRVANVKVPVERLIAGGRCQPFAFIGAIKTER